MKCKNCGKEMEEGQLFCGNCGFKNGNGIATNMNTNTNISMNANLNNTNINNNMNTNLNSTNMNVNSNNMNANINNNQNNMNANMNNNQNNMNNKPNKVKRDLIIAAIVLFVIILGIVIAFKNFTKNDNNDSLNNGEIKDNIENNQDEDKDNDDISKINDKSSLELLENDYKNKIIDVNKYFKELYYLQYDSEKLDKKYESDFPILINQNEIIKLLSDNLDKIDKDIAKKYLENLLMLNVKFGEKELNKEVNDKSNYELEFMDNKSGLGNHYLNKVILSEKENFLIWYADSGNDKISEEDAKNIAKVLENSIIEYEKLLNIKYKCNPITHMLNSNYAKAHQVMSANGIPIDKIKTAMSIFVYDTGSKHTYAAYLNPLDINLILDIVSNIDLNLFDNEMIFPRILVNQSIAFKNVDNSIQVYNHEMVHHFQYLYYESVLGKNKIGDKNYSEAIPNALSALITKSKTKKEKNCLNGWTNKYVSNIENNINNLQGYGSYPYFYVYIENVKNWNDTIMKAHLEDKPFEFVQNNTSIEDLKKVSDLLGYKVLTNSFNNNALYIDEKLPINKLNKDITKTINAGAINFYELNNLSSIKAESKSEYVGFKIYGLKNNKYTELMSNYSNLNGDLTKYSNYDKLILIVNNANIASNFEYSIKIKKNESDKTFKTSFDNYNVEISTIMSMSGMETKSVSKGVIDEKHQTEFLNVTTSTMGIDITSKLYYDFKTGYSYMSQPYNDKVWLKDKTSPQNIDLAKILVKLNNMKDVEKLSENKYKITMSKDDIVGANITSSVSVIVYTNNGYITKLEYDFSKIIKGIDKYNTTIKFSNYNNAGDIKIPDDIIKNAQNS